VTIKAIVLVNNSISSTLARKFLALEGIELEHVAVISLRQVSCEWINRCGIKLLYPSKASLTILGQLRFLGFYRRAAHLIRSILKQDSLKYVCLVNNDNLLCSHLLSWCEKHPGVLVSVLVEGLMNFQNITIQNRPRWRTSVKTLVSRLLGLDWRIPRTHLSGSGEVAVNQIVSFAERNLVAYDKKIVLVNFDAVDVLVVPACDSVLYVETALWQWMSEADFQQFALAFAAWVKEIGSPKLYIKEHPNYPPSDFQRNLLPPYELWGSGCSAETIAGQIPAKTVIGTCCTALATLKMLRPDLVCIDFGANFYTTKAYNGDQGCVHLMDAVGVELENMKHSLSTNAD